MGNLWIPILCTILTSWSYQVSSAPTTNVSFNDVQISADERLAVLLQEVFDIQYTLMKSSINGKVIRELKSASNDMEKRLMESASQILWKAASICNTSMDPSDRSPCQNDPSLYIESAYRPLLNSIMELYMLVQTPHIGKKFNFDDDQKLTQLNTISDQLRSAYSLHS